MRNQSGVTPERKKIASSFRDRAATVANYRRRGKRLGLVKRRIKNSTLKRDNRTLPINQNDSGGADLTKSLQKADVAFQRAMRQAIAQGLEHPPVIGVFKDTRPLNPPRLFDPVPHSSGCTSPALECAELMARND